MDTHDGLTVPPDDDQAATAAEIDTLIAFIAGLDPADAAVPGAELAARLSRALDAELASDDEPMISR